MQIKYTFDKETIKKIIAGALISGITAALIFILNLIMDISFANSQLTYVIAIFVPVITYYLKKYREGTIKILKVLKSFGLALSGVAIVYFSSTHITPEIDALIVFAAPAILNTIIEWFRGQIIKN